MQVNSPSTSIAEVSATNAPFNPYLPFASHSMKQDGLEDFDEKVPQSPKAPSTRSRFDGLTSIYRSVSWILGFRERYSLLLMIIFGGALVGFCLARAMMMRPANVRDLTIAGEWFWYRQPLYKPTIFMHIYLTIIAGIFAIFQFIPAIRRRMMILHRINGYFVLILLIPGIVGGTIVARRAFGGELNSQSGYYVLGSLIVFSACMGLLNVKQTRKHRKWMLRTVTFTCATITARLASICARHIISKIGTYYAVWRCDEILFVLQDANAVDQAYPECGQTGVSPGNIHVAVRAATNVDNLEYAASVRATFGMGLWIGILIHIVGIEFYIRRTEDANQHRRGFVLQREDDEDDAPKRAPDDY
ncbi:hypothetical protein JAAARDRAFT_37015 [Jaapia argillacea MUCL 33604]|uniref:Uncharacterized protein n=1 Tax=Jaapia argillacea MUCL 33604 TaxID=933084 RepID=A0A067PP69_9AGAM|nr:hypothetical protein JAAARDRAFT_37015 [Jaapia argillacea MUCL 33604]